MKFFRPKFHRISSFKFNDLIFIPMLKSKEQYRCTIHDGRYPDSHLAGHHRISASPVRRNTKMPFVFHHLRPILSKENTHASETLDEIEDMPETIWAIWLLVLTGCLLRGIQTLQWSHIFFNQSELRLPDSKTGAKIVQIG